jgi:hypothetical protein
MGKTIRIFAALALSALASTPAFAQGAPAAPGGQGAGRGPAAPPMPMSFFITSAPKGDGANYGGLAGADAYCTQLATAAGNGEATNLTNDHEWQSPHGSFVSIRDNSWARF